MSPGFNFGTGSLADVNKGLATYGKNVTAAWGDPNNADLSGYQRNMADTGLEQAKYNRPTTSGPFGTSTVDANGNVSQQFSGPFGQLNDNLTTQAANVAANPMDWGQFGTMGTGEDAGRQTAQASYDQSMSRLNPFWQKSEKTLRTNLLQSGMGDSTAADTTMGEFGRSRNDAYAGAMTDALKAGMGAQQNAFQGNLASRQNNLANVLRGQTQPFDDLNGMKGFLAQPQVNQDGSMMVRDAAFNQMAPISAIAAHEQGGIDQEMANLNKWGIPKSPEEQARQRAAFSAMTPEQRDFIMKLDSSLWG